MIRYDTHIHSAYSSDSGTPVQAQLDAAVSRGLSGLCITDHMDYSFPPACRMQGDTGWKQPLIPHKRTVPHGRVRKGEIRQAMDPRPISQLAG